MRRAAIWCAVLVMLEGGAVGAQEPPDTGPKTPPLVGKGRPKVPHLYQGKSADRLPQLLDRLSMVQATLREKQSNLTLYAKRTGGSVRTQLFVKERLHDLDESRAENNRIYDEFEQTVQDANRQAPPSPDLTVRIGEVQRAQAALQQAYDQLAATYSRVWPGHPPAGAPETPLPPPVPGRGEVVVGAAPTHMAPASEANSSVPEGGDERSYKAALGEIQSVLSSNTADSDKKADAYRRFIKLKSQHERRPSEPNGEGR
jgi:hypothetical protein